METINFSFDISTTSFDANQANRFRKDLSNNLCDARRNAGIGECTHSRRTMNDIIISVKTKDYKEAMEVIEPEIQNPEWFPNMTLTKKNAQVELPAS